MADYDGWQTLEPLGEGGQGTVYKARSPKKVSAIQASERRIGDALRQINGNMPMTYAELAKLIVEVGGPDEPDELGALKVFKIPGNGSVRAKAYGRLAIEINALNISADPALLKLLHHNKDKGFIVTEYHPLGALNSHLGRYKGRALEALLAFEPLIQAVGLIHRQGAIHRDIKPENIFVATDERLVLGDFGIVFFADAQRTRLTDTYDERVGSHYWMAPWAYEPVQLSIDEINPSLDIFPLGKVLWSMIAGRNGFPFWEYDRPEYNLVNLFPDDPAMPIVNYVLSKCIVRNDADCAQNTTVMKSLVDEAIGRIARLDRRSDGDTSWRCLVCKKGYYQQKNSLRWRGQEFIKELGVPVTLNTRAYFCSHCGHVQFFQE
ncbi:MAG TPA: protein kinase [Bryobacteraceae bacterium]|nr:protein kinase [Bryobacteraceae bacterium]